MSFQSVTPQGPTKTGTDTWITPQWIIDKIGISDLDPCGWLPNGQPIVRTALNYFDESTNGLNKDWTSFKSVFVNFPYSQSREWLKKCKEEAKRGCEIIVLCFVRSDTKAWQENVKFATGLNLINRRVKFLDSQGTEKGNGNAPSCLIAFGEESFKRIKNVNGIITRMENEKSPN